MPEGHTLHRLAGALEAAFAGTAPAASSPQGRFVAGAARLDGLPVVSAQAWGKHLFVEFDGAIYLHVHLGLIGTFDVLQYAGVLPAAVGAVRLRLANDTHVADLRGATLVELLTPEHVDAIVSRLGPDPLRAECVEHGADLAWAKIRRSARPIADLLMDQRVVAGVGNVYRAEVLFRHRVDPHRPGREIRRSTWEALWGDLVQLLKIGVELGQIVTMADQVHEVRDAAYDPELVPEAPSGVSAWRPKPLPGALERRYYVYKRQGEPCRECGSRIRVADVAGRRLYWCGRCQRRR